MRKAVLILSETKFPMTWEAAEKKGMDVIVFAPDLSNIRASFEVENVVSFGIPVRNHCENGITETIYQYPLPFMEPDHSFHLAWQGFFCNVGTKAVFGLINNAFKGFEEDANG